MHVNIYVNIIFIWVWVQGWKYGMTHGHYLLKVETLQVATEGHVIGFETYL